MARALRIGRESEPVTAGGERHDVAGLERDDVAESHAPHAELGHHLELRVGERALQTLGPRGLHGLFLLRRRRIELLADRIERRIRDDDGERPVVEAVRLDRQPEAEEQVLGRGQAHEERVRLPAEPAHLERDHRPARRPELRQHPLPEAFQHTLLDRREVALGDRRPAGRVAAERDLHERGDQGRWHDQHRGLAERRQAKEVQRHGPGQVRCDARVSDQLERVEADLRHLAEEGRERRTEPAHEPVDDELQAGKAAAEVALAAGEIEGSDAASGRRAGGERDIPIGDALEERVHLVLRENLIIHGCVLAHPLCRSPPSVLSIGRMPAGD